MKKIFMLGSILLALSAPAFSQNSDGYWKRLQKSHPETTLEALESNAPAVSQAPSGQAELPACRLALVYEGKSRSISMENIQLMKEKGLKPGTIREYRKELLFKSGSKEVWLPTKSTLVDQLEIEARPEEQVLLYTSVLKDNSSQDSPMTLLVEDFQVK